MLGVPPVLVPGSAPAEPPPISADALGPAGEVDEPPACGAPRIAATRIEPPGKRAAAVSAPLTMASAPALITCWNGRAGGAVVRAAVGLTATLGDGPAA